MNIRAKFGMEVAGMGADMAKIAAEERQKEKIKRKYKNKFAMIKALKAQGIGGLPIGKGGKKSSKVRPQGNKFQKCQCCQL